MDPLDELENNQNLPGEDESWLTRGSLQGSSITEETRTGIVDWLIQVQQYMFLIDVTLHRAVANFDLVLSSVEVEDDKVQLLSLICLSLAKMSSSWQEQCLIFA